MKKNYKSIWIQSGLLLVLAFSLGQVRAQQTTVACDDSFKVDYTLDNPPALVWSQTYGEYKLTNFYVNDKLCVLTEDGGYICAVKFRGGGDLFVIRMDIDDNMLWSSTLVNTDASYDITDILKTQNDNYYLVGVYTTITPTANEKGALEIKIDGTGNILSTKREQIDGFSINSAVSTQDGGYISVGNIFANNGLGQYAFIRKVNSQGVLDIDISFGEPNFNTSIEDVVATPDGGMIIVGNKHDLGANAGNDYGYWAKIDSQGNQEWIKLSAGTGYETANLIEDSKDGNFVMLGRRDSDYSIAKINNQGDVLWDKRYPLSDLSYQSRLYGPGNGNIIIATVIGNTTNGTDKNTTLIYLDSDGNTLWQQAYPTGENLSLFNMFAGANKSLYLSALNTDPNVLGKQLFIMAFNYSDELNTKGIRLYSNDLQQFIPSDTPVCANSSISVIVQAIKTATIINYQFDPNNIPLFIQNPKAICTGSGKKTYAIPVDTSLLETGKNTSLNTLFHADMTDSILTISIDFTAPYYNSFNANTVPNSNDTQITLTDTTVYPNNTSYLVRTWTVDNQFVGNSASVHTQVTGSTSANSDITLYSKISPVCDVVSITKKEKDSLDNKFCDDGFKVDYTLDNPPALVWSQTYGESNLDNNYSANNICALTEEGDYICATKFRLKSGLFVTRIGMEGNTVWSSTIDDSRYSYSVTDIFRTRDNNNYYIVGDYTDNQTNDVGIIEIKIDVLGNVLSTKRESKDSLTKSVFPAREGGYIAVGAFFANNSQYGYVRKVNSQGLVEIDKTFGELNKTTSLDGVVETKDGGMIVVGYTNGFGVQAQANGLWMKLDAQGNQEWMKFSGGAGFETSDQIVDSGDGNFIMTGQRALDYSIAKIDGQGNIIWDNVYSNSYFPEDRYLYAPGNGSVVVVFITNSTINGVSKNASLLYFDSNGQTLWQKVYPTGGDIKLFNLFPGVNRSFYLGALRGALYASQQLSLLAFNYSDELNTKGIRLYSNDLKEFVPEDAPICPESSLSVIVQDIKSSTVLDYRFLPDNTPFSQQNTQSICTGSGKKTYAFPVDIALLRAGSNSVLATLTHADATVSIRTMTLNFVGAYSSDFDSNSIFGVPNANFSQITLTDTTVYPNNTSYLVRTWTVNNLFVGSSASVYTQVLSSSSANSDITLYSKISPVCDAVSITKKENNSLDNKFCDHNFKVDYTLDNPPALVWSQTYGEYNLSYTNPEDNICALTKEGDYMCAAKVLNKNELVIRRIAVGGNTIWSLTLVDADYSYDVSSIFKVLNDDNYYIVGSYSTSKTNGVGILEVKVDGLGNVLSTQRTPGNILVSVARPSRAGGYIVTGILSSNTVNYGFIKKINAQGLTEIDKTFGEPNGNTSVKDVVETQDGGMIIVGYTSSFGVQVTNGFWIKLDAQGNQEWMKLSGGSGYESTDQIVDSGDGNFVMVGERASDYSIAKIDENGNIIWDVRRAKYFFPDDRYLYAPGNGSVMVVFVTNSTINGVGKNTSLQYFDSNGQALWQGVYPTGGNVKLFNLFTGEDRSFYLAALERYSRFSTGRRLVLMAFNYLDDLNIKGIRLYSNDLQEFVPNDVPICLESSLSVIVQDIKSSTVLDYRFLPDNTPFSQQNSQSICTGSGKKTYAFPVDIALLKSGDNTVLATLTHADTTASTRTMTLNFIASYTNDFDSKSVYDSSNVNFAQVTLTDTSVYPNITSYFIRTWTVNNHFVGSSASVLTQVMFDSNITSEFTNTLYTRISPICDMLSVTKKDYIIFCPNSVMSSTRILKNGTRYKNSLIVCKDEVASLEYILSPTTVSELTVTFPDGSKKRIYNTQANSRISKFVFSLETQTLSIGKNQFVLEANNATCDQYYIYTPTLDYGMETFSVTSQILTQACSGETTFLLNASGKYLPLLHTWTLNQGSSFNTTQKVINLLPGFYSYVLNVQDSALCQTSIQGIFSVDYPPTPILTFTLYNVNKASAQDFLCKGDTMSLSVESSEIFKQVKPNDKLTTYMSPSPGTYVFEGKDLEEFFPAGQVVWYLERFTCGTLLQTFTFEYHTLTPTFSYQTYLCGNTAIVFSDTSEHTYPIVNQQWEINSMQYSGTNVPLSSYLTSTILSLTVTDNKGCFASLMTTVVLPPSENFVLTSQGFSECLSQSITVSRNTIDRIDQQGQVEYKWWFNNGLVYSGNNTSVMISYNSFDAQSVNTFTLEVNIVGKERCEINLPLPVKDILIPAFSYLGNNSILCDGNELPFVNNSLFIGNSPTAKLYITTSTLQSGTSQGVSPTQDFSVKIPVSDIDGATQYTIYLFLETANCSVSSSQIYDIYKTPRINQSTGTLVFCAYDNNQYDIISLTVNSLDSGNWSVDFGNSAIVNNRELVPNTIPEGKYVVKVQRANAYCSTSVNVNVSVLPRPQFHFASSQYQFGDTGALEIVIDKIGTNTYTFEWSSNVAASQASKLNPTITLKNNERYSFILRDAIGCFQETTTVIYKFKQEELPNFLTLGGSKKNEYIDVRYMRDFFPTMRIFVYSLWGRELYYSTFSDRESLYWNPSLQNPDLPSGHYVFHIDFGNLKKENYTQMLYLLAP